MESKLTQYILVGAPNSGKTTLYNWLTGSKFRTVNYPGATVEYSIGETLKQLSAEGEPSIQVMDTPGLRSLQALSLEEQVTVDALVKKVRTQPIVVIAVVDATQISRHLFLVHQLKDMGVPVVVAVTMLDLLQKRDEELNLSKLEKHLQMPVVAMNGRLGGGLKELIQAARKLAPSTPHEAKIKKLDNVQIANVFERLDAISNDVVKVKNAKAMRIDPVTEKIDRVLMHPVLGLLVFAAMMFLLFASIFWAAAPVMQLVSNGLDKLAEFVSQKGDGALWADFVSSGMIRGVSAILVFVPQIFILFLGMGFLEESGYLARAATLVDKPLSKIGLNGRSFLPLLSGYACAIPGMMSARTIASRKERMLTLFIMPLMSCSARLPVFALLLGFLYPDAPSKAAVALVIIYFGSMLLGSVTAALAGRFLQLEKRSWFLLELPTYRVPRAKVILKHTWDRSVSFVTRAGPTIFVVSLLIWVGTTFPRSDLKTPEERLPHSYAAHLGVLMNPLLKPMGVDWRTGVGMISAFAAREVFVATTALLYQVPEGEKEAVQAGLITAMREAKLENGQPVFTFSSVVGLIVYFMIALQCLSTVAVSRRESGSWKFALTQLAVFTLGGYLLAIAVVQGLRAFGVT